MATHLETVDWSRIPEPKDDAAADHLIGAAIADVKLSATNGAHLNLPKSSGTDVIYIYPMTGRPDRALPNGWDMLPGARGCTPQSCAFRDHHSELTSLGVDRVFGLSTQGSDYQAEAKLRLHLPFELLSDEKLEFADAMGLPRFEVEGMVLLRRITLIITRGIIAKHFYPVFPPDRNAQDVMDWLAVHHK